MHNVTQYRSRYQTLVTDTPINSKMEMSKSYNLRITQEYFQPKIRQKNKNIQPGPEKQHSNKKKSVSFLVHPG